MGMRVAERSGAQHSSAQLLGFTPRGASQSSFSTLEDFNLGNTIHTVGWVTFRVVFREV